MPRRRRVDDDQVVAALLVQLVELLHRHVLLRARERAGDVPVEAVLEDPLPPARACWRSGTRARRTSSGCRASAPTGARSAPPSPSGSQRSRGDLVRRRCRAPRGRACRRAASPGRWSRRPRHARRARLPARAPRPSSSCRRRPCRSTRAPALAHERPQRRHASGSREPRDLVGRARRRAGRSPSGPISPKRNGSRICGSGSRAARRSAWLARERVPFAREVRGGVERGRSSTGIADVGGEQRRRRRGARRARGPPGTRSRRSGASETPTRSSSANAVSTSSFTGVSSGRVTSITRHRVGSESSSMTSWACVRTGPTRTASSSPRADVRNVIAWPAAGASMITRSAAPARSSCFTLPSTRMSFIPGTAVATTSSAPDRTRRFEMRRRPRSSRYSSSACSGVSVRARIPGPDLGLVVGELWDAEARRRDPICLRPRRSARSCRRGRRRPRAQRSPSSSPTPPLPATISTREAAQSCARCMPGA